MSSASIRCASRVTAEFGRDGTDDASIDGKAEPLHQVRLQRNLQIVVLR